MIDKLDIASKNWADDYMTQFGRRFNNMLRDAFIAGFKKGVALSKEIVRCGECKHWDEKPLIKNEKGMTRFGVCRLWHDGYLKADFYCADGKRKDGAE